MKKISLAITFLIIFVLFGCAYIIERPYRDPYKHFNRGNYYFKNNEIKKAIKEFKKTIKIDPDFALAYNHLGEVYTFLEMYEEAIHEYERALEINPKLSEAHFNMVISYMLLKNYSLAWKHVDILNKLGEDTKILTNSLIRESRKPIY